MTTKTRKLPACTESSSKVKIHWNRSKKPLAFLLCLFIVGFGYGQNLVPNAEFEDLIECPFSYNIESFLNNWKSARETPDYFNSCATWNGASVPSNGFGYQPAFSGNGYIGMLTYRADSSIYSEAIGVQLTSPLTIGLRYYVSFKVSLTLESITESLTANNKIGVQFSMIEYLPSSQLPINNFAHIWSDSIITDTMNWTTISGSFIADSAYSYLNLGNFFDKPFVDTISYGTPFGAYYFIDNVCVSTDSLLCNSSAGIDENNNLSINIYHNPIEEYFNISNLNEPYDLIIYNAFGQLLFQENNITEQNKKINISRFGTGLLLLNIKSNNHTLNYKLLKN